MLRPRVKGIHKPVRLTPTLINIGGRQLGIGAEIDDENGTIRRLPGLMDGTRTQDEIVAALLAAEPGMPGPQARGALDALIESGFVEDAAAPPPPTLTPAEIDRYDRAFAYYAWVDLTPRPPRYELQAKLKASRVTVLGLGGTGSAVASSLIAAGVGDVHCGGFDRVEPSNLTRQLLYSEADIGASKVDVAVQRLRGLNSFTRVTGQEPQVGGAEDVEALMADRDRHVRRGGRDRRPADRTVPVGAHRRAGDRDRRTGDRRVHRRAGLRRGADRRGPAGSAYGRRGAAEGRQVLVGVADPAPASSSPTSWSSVWPSSTNSGMGLAGVAVGVPSRLRIERRGIFPALETDLSGLWALPAAKRYGPFLAGMAVDAVLLFLALLPRFAWSHGWIDLPPLLVRFLAVVVFGQLLKLVFQTLAYLRTDMYLVLATATGCRNLHQVTRLSLKRLIRRLKPDEQVILRDAHARDLRVSRWNRLLYVTGITWMGWFAYFYLWPSAKVVFGWMGGVLRDEPIGSYGWWEAVVLGAFAAFNLFLPLAVVIRNRREARRALA